MQKLSKAATALAAFAAVTSFAGAAQAQGKADGKIQIKLLASAVLGDGKISKVDYDPLGLTAGAQTYASDNVVPTAAIEYFFTPNISVETICCFTQHHVNGTGSLAGTNLVNHVLILPATLTAKYHLQLPMGIKPYIGAGPAMFFIFDTKPGATAQALGVDKVNLSDKVGAAVQAGVDIPINKTGLGISFDAKKYFVGTTAHFYAGGTEVLTTEHKINPWVLSGGVSYRF